MIPTLPVCPVCRRSLALGDRNGRHVASEAHYPHLDARGAMVCSPPGGEVQLRAFDRTSGATFPTTRDARRSARTIRSSCRS